MFVVSHLHAQKLSQNKSPLIQWPSSSEHERIATSRGANGKAGCSASALLYTILPACPFSYFALHLCNFRSRVCGVVS